LNILVTGGTGFIGGNFINAVPDGVGITATRRSGSVCKVKLIRDVHWLQKGIDELDSEDLVGIDALVHFASVGVSPQKATWEELYHWNVSCSLSLVQAAAKAGVGRIIAAGSFIEYGLSADRYEHIPPTAALLPTTPYASSKAAAFEMVHAFCINAKIPLFYNRIFSAYGQGQFGGNFWPSLRDAALNGEDFPMSAGEQIRDFISVDDVATAFVNDLTSEVQNDLNPQVKNICSGQGISVLDFAKRCWSDWGARGKLLPGVMPSRGNEPVRFVGQP
jgi:UDP-glucose 4-epimerase